jgi:photosystem II stability/assembly factor-like uncharacterized protein
MDGSGSSSSGSSSGGFSDASTYVDQVAPTPPSNWVNVSHELAGMASECGNLSFMSSHPAIDMLIAGVAQKGLWASTDGAASWHAIGTGAGSAPITNRTSDFVYDPANKDAFWESGIYNAGGVYHTTDDGTTFVALGDVHHNDSVSVDLADPMRQTLLVGGHEQKQTLYLSTNGGGTWTNIGPSLPAGTNFCTQTLVIDSMTFLVGCSGWGGGTNGVFRSTDGGKTWTQASTIAVGNHPLRASDGSIYWTVIYDNGLAKSTDQGQTWTQIVGPNTMRAVTPVELPDHRIAGAGFQNVVLSSDGGQSWKPVGTSAADALPYTPSVLAYSAFRRAFFISHWDCTNNVPMDAIEEYGFDYTKQ